MAETTYADLKIYNDQFWSGFNEQSEQNNEAFNAASNGCLLLSTKALKGHYTQEAFFKYLSSLISRRDISSVGTVSDLQIEMGEHASVKLNRKVGPVLATHDAFVKAGMSMDDFARALGEKAGVEVPEEQLNTILLSIYSALSGVSALIQDSSSETMSHTQLVKAMRKMGDKASRIACWVMHSTSYYDLVQQSIADKIFEIAGATIYSGTPATMNKPVVVTDSASLILADETPDQYITFGLVPGAAMVVNSEENKLVIDEITGLANLAQRYQAEHAYNISVKGFTWDMGNGGVNPDATALGTNSNWDKIAASNKSLAGVMLLTKALS